MLHVCDVQLCLELLSSDPHALFDVQALQGTLHSCMSHQGQGLMQSLALALVQSCPRHLLRSLANPLQALMKDPALADGVKSLLSHIICSQQFAGVTRCHDMKQDLYHQLQAAFKDDCIGLQTDFLVHVILQQSAMSITACALCTCCSIQSGSKHPCLRCTPETSHSHLQKCRFRKYTAVTAELSGGALDLETCQVFRRLAMQTPALTPNRFSALIQDFGNLARGEGTHDVLLAYEL